VVAVELTVIQEPWPEQTENSKRKNKTQNLFIKFIAEALNNKSNLSIPEIERIENSGILTYPSELNH